MSLERVAIIYSDKPRPETTGFYCRRALGKLVQVEHFLPGELDRVPRTGFDLYFNVDDGLDYRLPPDLRPCAWWAIDTHLDFDKCLEKAHDFDFVFAAQRDGAERLAENGIASATWLPLASDPAIHQKHEREKTLDWCFVGNVFGGVRAELLEMLQRRFPSHFVGQRYFEEMANAYSAARVVFNRSVANDVNMRVFEALACGSLLLTNDLGDNGQSEFFQDGVHLATYADAEELLYKLAYYLDHEEARERIAAAGRSEVLARHTYQQRMAMLLAAVESGARSVERGANSPVGAMLSRGVCKEELAASPTAKACGQPEVEARSACFRGVSASSPVPPLDPRKHGTHNDEVSPVPPLDPRKHGTRNNGQPSGVADPSYFQCTRPDLLEMIPQTARAVLDVGCGAGKLGAALKARQAADVTGVEMNAQAAEGARENLDHVHVANAESWEPESGHAGFDAIVCGDVLEHMREPMAFLRRARGWLKDDGVLIASIPNVRHHSVLRGLLEGNWTYEPAGLLDRDHVRFFTRREIEKLFDRAGLAIADMRMVPGWGYDEWRGRGSPGEVKAGRLHIGGMAPAEAEELYVYQYLIKAGKAPVPDYGLTSIVIVTHNQLAFTRACLDSIALYTDEPYELIVVDNGSTDGTVEYLRSRPGVKLIENSDNRGFPAAANQGMQAAAGKQVLLLNNDTLVTTGWLKRLLAGLHREANIGLAGPCSNCVSGPQQIEVGYDDVGALDGFAWDWAKANAGVTVDTDRLVGFCLLIRRELIDKIGLLDERFGIGCFEDDDYCRRVLTAGYRAVMVRDGFVHHAGGQTFRANGIDYGALMRKNQALFREKWEPPNRGVNGVSRSAKADGSAELSVRAAVGGGLRLARRAINLSACIIARDNEKIIGACVKSIRKHVDEVIVVDTGSKDATAKMAAELGARVFHFPWCDSFSKARNESLRHARGQWIFWMDTDDTIDETNGRKLRAIVRRAMSGPPSNPPILGYVMQVHCPGREDEEGNVTVVDHLKLFRNLPELRFEGRIHEQIIPSIRRAGGEIDWTDVFVVHSGYDHSPEGQERKKKRDLHLLHLELSEQPEHPFTLFNLGMTYADIGQHQEAVGYLRHSIRNSGNGESHLRKAYALLTHSLQQLGQMEEAWQNCHTGLAKFPDDPELLFRKAALLHAAGRNTEAVKAYHDVLNARPARHFSSIVRGIQGHLTRHNLAILYEDMGELAKAEEQWRTVCREVPGYKPGRRGLEENLHRQGKLAPRGVA